jgi:hypothetical protein
MLAPEVVGDLRSEPNPLRPSWVRLGKARGEHNESGVPQKADVVGKLSHFRVGANSGHDQRIISASSATWQPRGRAR